MRGKIQAHRDRGVKLCPLPSFPAVLSFLWTLCADLGLWAGPDAVRREAVAGAESVPAGPWALWLKLERMAGSSLMAKTEADGFLM